jgi:hypothetical protein
MKNNKTTWLVTIGFVAVIGLAIWAAIENEKKWQAFIVENECKVTAKIASKTISTSHYDVAQGKYVNSSTTIPGTTTWKCADGVEYTR